jgi:hypothetical protein
MRILWDLPLLQQGCQVLHWKSGHKICKRKGRVDFALFNIPRIAKFDACDNERKHGGVAEPIRRLMGDVNLEEEKKFSN